MSSQASLRPDVASRVLPRVTRRLVSFAFICYVVAYIDRVNVGFVSTILQRELGLSNQAYGFGAGLFFLGYFLFEIPSNLILERVGARRWIARIMIVWGFVSMGTIFVTGERSFYAMRFLLGLAEAGFFPGIVLYLTYWIPARERAGNGALFMMAAPVAMLVGAPLSEALLGLDGVAGFAGWQWLFLIEGLPAVVLGVLALVVLTDRPEQASWLDPEGRAWLSQQMARERSERVAHGGSWRSLLDRKLLLLCLIYFLNTTVTYGIFLWLPRMLEESLGRRSFALVMIPFAFALVAMVLIGRHSDKTGERKRHVAACALVAAIGLVLAASFQPQSRAAGAEPDHLPDRAALDPAHVLGDPARVPRRHGGGRGHRPHQLDREPGWADRAVAGGIAPRPDPQPRRRPTAARRSPRRRSRARAVAAAPGAADARRAGPSAPAHRRPE